LKVLVVIPTFNEKDNVANLAANIFQEIPKNLDILFVDDNSPDGTGALLDQLSSQNPRIKVLHRKGKLGLASAYIQGFQLGMSSSENYDWFVEMDADFSHDPKHLAEFVQIMREQTTVLGSQKISSIVGSRYIKGGGVVNWEKSRLILSRLGTLYSQFWLGYPINDWTGGFNCWSRDLVKALRLESLKSKGYAFQIEMKFRALVLGAKLIEAPIIFQERRAGASKMSGSIVKEAIWGVMRLKMLHGDGKLFS